MTILTGNSTNQSIYLDILDSSSSTGARLTGLTFDSAGLTAYYVHPQGAPTAITLAELTTPTDAWVQGGFIEVDAVNMPGLYRLDIPDNAAQGVGTFVTVRGAANMQQVTKEITVTAFDLQTSMVDFSDTLSTDIITPLQALLPGIIEAALNIYHIDDVYTLTDYLTFIGATLAGKISGAEGTTITMRDLLDTYGVDAVLTKLATGSYQLLVYIPNAAASTGEWKYEGAAVDGSSNPLTVSVGGFEVGVSERLGTV